jgi:photosystem II stability/assembly factor-like uncharacterized protein
LFSGKIFSQWQLLDDIGNSYPLDIIASGDSIYIASDSGLFRSTNNGLNWSHHLIDSIHTAVTSLAIHEQKIYAGTFIGVYVSPDYGETWEPFGLQQYSILSVFATNTIVLACIHGGGLFRTENNGINWQPIDGNHFYSFMTRNDKIFAGTFSGIQVSTDNGLSWNFCGGYIYQMVPSVSKNKRYLYAASWHNMFRSGDDGDTWEPSSQGLPIGSLGLSSVIAKDDLVFAGLETNRVYFSPDTGSNWFDISQGLPPVANSYIGPFAISGSKLLACCYSAGVWWIDISNLTAIENESDSAVPQITLYQNYPNPFNSTTSIRYSIPKSGVVTLKIFNVLGQEIDTPVHEYQLPGDYIVDFDAKYLTGGIYFYQLILDDINTTKQMTFQK